MAKTIPPSSVIPEKSLSEKLLDLWWGKALLGLFFLLFAFLEHRRLTNFEESGQESIRLDKFTWLLYSMGGKITVDAIFIFIGTAFLAAGVVHLLRKKA